MRIAAGDPFARSGYANLLRAWGGLLRAALWTFACATSALLLLNATAARGGDPRQGSGDPPVDIVLGELEREFATVASDGPNSNRLAQIKAEANDAWQRSTTASERSRARILIRDVDRLAKRELPSSMPGPGPAAAAANPTGLQTPSGFVTLAQNIVPGPLDPVLPSYPGAPITGPPLPNFVPWAPPPLPRHYVSFDALGWWVKQDHVPALVTTSPLGTPQALAGVLGQPTTRVLFGDQGMNGGIRPGGRVQGGVWLDPMQTFAIEGHYYALATATTSYNATSTFSNGALTDPILARPFFNDAPGVNQQRSVLSAFPNFIIQPPLLPPTAVNIDGSIQVRESSNIQSAGGGGRYALNEFASPLRLFVVGAYRYFNLNESLGILASSSPGNNPFPFPIPQGRIDSFDQFATKNIFNGGEVGFAAEARRMRWSLVADTRLAMGNMHQTLNIDGRTSAISGGYVASYPGGLYAQPSNIGSFSRDRFSLIPQADLKLGFQLFPSLRLTAGYNFTYVTNVLRPGAQVDTTVNTTQIAGLHLVGPARPQALFNDSGIWLQGVTAGMDLRF